MPTQKDNDLSFDFQPFHPYLLRAAYDWLADSNVTIYLDIDATLPQVIVPMQCVENGRIILDISPTAINRLDMGNELVEFEARFGSAICFISVPVAAIIAIYSPQYGQGVRFKPGINIATTDIPAPQKHSSPSLTSIIIKDKHQNIPNQDKENMDNQDQAAKAKLKTKPDLVLIKTSTKDE